MARGVHPLSACVPGAVASDVIAHRRTLLDRLPWWTGATGAGLVVFVLVGVPLAVLLGEVGELPFARVAQDVWLRRVIGFSLSQAAMSAVLALGLAIPVALALHHERRFPGRGALTGLFGLSLVLPAIAAVFGIVAVWGGAGWINGVLDAISVPFRADGAEPPRLPVLYGLNGILLAHVFFNAPLAARVLLQALDGIALHEWRLAAQLGMSAPDRLRLLQWPVIARRLPGLATLIFTLCFTSFAIVLALGGGPRATTVEVAVYQALRFDFDLPLAVTLALVQLTICAVLTGIGSAFGRSDDGSLGLSERAIDGAPWPHWHPHARRGGWHQLLDRFAIALAALLVLPPFVALLIAGINRRTVAVLGDAITLDALLNTVIVALAAAALSVTLALGLLSGVRRLQLRAAKRRDGRDGGGRGGEALQALGNAILVIPPIVLGTGLFLSLRPWADVFSLALLLVILINALMGLPFALRILAGPVLDGAASRDRLARSLGMARAARWRLVDAALLRRPVALAAAVSATLAAGDLGAIALFGSDQVRTLPLLLQTRLGSHRLDEAAVTATLLVLTCAILFASLKLAIGGTGERDA